MIARSSLKRIGLIAIGIAILALSLLPGWPQAQDRLWAQDSPFETFTPTPTITDTPGPTPTKVFRVVNEITEPKAVDAISGRINIVGTALVSDFLRYDVHISPAGLDDWHWLDSSYEVVHDGVLYTIDTTKFADGFYDIRVRAIKNDGNYTEAFVRGVEIRNVDPPTETPIPGATPTPYSPLPTPTPTVDINSRIPGGPGFYAPDNGAVVRGVVDIVATVNGTPDNPFRRYELAVSPAGAEIWNWLDGSTQQAWQQTIYQFDTTQFPDGLYDLRLRIVYRDSNYSEFFLRNLSIANHGRPVLAFHPPAGISIPHSESKVSGVVNFFGTVPPNDLLRWELAWSPSSLEQWTTVFNGDQALDNGLLARLDLSHLASGLYDFRLRVVRKDQNYTDYVVRALRVIQPTDP